MSPTSSTIFINFVTVFINKSVRGYITLALGGASACWARGEEIG